MSKSILSMKDIYKSYQVGDLESVILKGVNLELSEGEFLAILGPSGSGKSTLMNIIGCLDVPSSGSYTLDGMVISDQSEKQLAAIRRNEIGFIFQSYYMLPGMKAYENVELPLIYAGVPQKERYERAVEMLCRVGLEDRIDYYPKQLSGGQQQRIAIARAMVTNPTILLADEPTGALDQTTGAQIMGLFQEINDEGRSIIMITHDENIAKRAKRIARLRDGVLTGGDAA
jgi:putative ABC transport system ATP-binding protein